MALLAIFKIKVNVDIENEEKKVLWESLDEDNEMEL